MLSSILRGSSVALRGAAIRSAVRPAAVVAPALRSPIRFYSSGLNKDDVSSRIIDVVKAFDKTTASAQVTNETHFAKDLGLDSLDTVELLVAIEEEFDIEIPDKVADEIKTVEAAVKYIESNPEAN
ncbi:LADA_0H13916g1_1 [Lachancea dasiensis]|uniref:Acyl carrier protein n=1 Tax=Lachancea dasiensis TaxID=1072105 RepID=A0A1G4K485_9SACH|nr:LADA_0H13916g1_1 [Lachancea dasiensis]